MIVDDDLIEKEDEGIGIDLSKALQFCNEKCKELFQLTVSCDPIQKLDLSRNAEILNEKKFFLTKLSQSDIDTNYSQELIKQIKEIRSMFE